MGQVYFARGRARALGGVLALALLVGCSLDPAGAEASASGAGATTSTGGTAVSSSSAGGMEGTGGSAGQGGVSTGGSGSGGTRGTCPGTHGPEMLFVRGPSGTYCVDRTEVTSAQYAEWLVSVPLPDPSDSLCGWKATAVYAYVPRAGLEECESKHYDPVGRPDHPVACVDWCDARAYCKWAGKRLCGSLLGGKVAYDDQDDPAQSEWMNACSDAGQKQYPYGDSFDGAVCVGDAYDGQAGDGASDDNVPVGSAASCVGGVSDLRDMSGNVWEAEDACDESGEPRDHRCRYRGGSFWDADGALTCAHGGYDEFTRSYFNKNLGFRCCADAAR